jgi:hypothetical protein
MLFFLSEFQRVKLQTVSFADPRRNAVATFVLRPTLHAPLWSRRRTLASGSRETPQAVAGVLKPKAARGEGLRRRRRLLRVNSGRSGTAWRTTSHPNRTLSGWFRYGSFAPSATVRRRGSRVQHDPRSPRCLPLKLRCLCPDSPIQRKHAVHKCRHAPMHADPLADGARFYRAKPAKRVSNWRSAGARATQAASTSRVDGA